MDHGDGMEVLGRPRFALDSRFPLTESGRASRSDRLDASRTEWTGPGRVVCLFDR